MSQTDTHAHTHTLADLQQIMLKLRAECPWDKIQTPQTLSRYAIEEAYEVEAAIREGDTHHIKEELGDLLLQVIFQSCMFAEQQAFNFEDVVDTLAQKLIRRHPHVFNQDEMSKIHHLESVAQTWVDIKQQEKLSKSTHQNALHHSLLADVKAGSPLTQAQDLQKIAAKVGFDWEDVAGAQTKVHEEILELDEAITTGDANKIIDELGDCFFALTNVARKLNIQSETALLSTIHKFKSRFRFIEVELEKIGKTPETSNLEEMDALWHLAKKNPQ